MSDERNLSVSGTDERIYSEEVFRRTFKLAAASHDLAIVKVSAQVSLTADEFCDDTSRTCASRIARLDYWPHSEGPISRGVEAY